MLFLITFLDEHKISGLKFIVIGIMWSLYFLQVLNLVLLPLSPKY